MILATLKLIQFDSCTFWHFDATQFPHPQSCFSGFGCFNKIWINNIKSYRWKTEAHITICESNHHLSVPPVLAEGSEDILVMAGSIWITTSSCTFLSLLVIHSSVKSLIWQILETDVTFNVTCTVYRLLSPQPRFFFSSDLRALCLIRRGPGRRRGGRGRTHWPGPLSWQTRTTASYWRWWTPSPG